MWNPFSAIKRSFWRVVFWWKHRAGFIDLSRDVVVTGVVWRKDDGPSDDGDYCFSIVPDPEFGWTVVTFGGRITSESPDEQKMSLHCEVPPWYSDLYPAVADLKVGDHVRVYGRWGYDGVHTHSPMWLEILKALVGHGPDVDGGWCEIHPVTKIEKLASSSSG